MSVSKGDSSKLFPAEIVIIRLIPLYVCIDIDLDIDGIDIGIDI